MLLGQFDLTGTTRIHDFIFLQYLCECNIFDVIPQLVGGYFSLLCYHALLNFFSCYVNIALVYNVHPAFARSL